MATRALLLFAPLVRALLWSQTRHRCPSSSSSALAVALDLAKGLGLPRDSFAEGSDARYAALLRDCAESVSVDDLQARWIDVCIERGEAFDMRLFSLARCLPLAFRRDAHVVVVNKTAELKGARQQQQMQSEELFVTEQELRRLWSAARDGDAFDVREALLLLLDEEDRDFLDFRSALDERAPSLRPVLGAGQALDTVVVSEAELRRVWAERAQVRWGMPGDAFDARSALLLLDEEDDDELDEEFVSAAALADHEPVPLPPPLPPPLLPLPSPCSSCSPCCRAQGTEVRAVDGAMEAALLRLTLDLDDRADSKVAWKKDRMFLTPDIDTQDFEGDMMMSNTYMTQRVPANWDDPELEGMGDVYLSTGTMAWPGEEEVDYNAVLPMWEVLDLPFGERSPAPAPELAPSDPWLGQEEGDAGSAPIDLDSFFGASEPAAQSPENRVSQSADRATRINNIENLVRGNSKSMVLRGWRTPADWLSAPCFAEHVGIEEWGRADAFAHLGAFEDDEWSDEDVHTAMSVRLVLAVADLYLRDHLQQSRRDDDLRYWQRQLSNRISDRVVEREEIPLYLTPDIDRGVEYGDEIYEMKGKITLHPAQPPPAVMFANDSFTPNEELRPVSPIGTVREVYDWTPTSAADAWRVDPAVAARIGPLLLFVNHAAALRCTRGNVLTFEYLGQMRHLIGIRETMLTIGRQCFPELVDILLETERKTDKFDI